LNFPKHNPRQLEFVEQRRRTDCGVACMGMLAGYMYEDMASIVLSLGKTIKGGMYPEDVLEVLEALGHYCVECKKLPSKGHALVALQWKDEGLSGHYVIWDNKRKQFLDPINGLIEKKELLKVAIIERIFKVSWRRRKNVKVPRNKS